MVHEKGIRPEIRRVRADEVAELAALAARLFPAACPPGLAQEDIDQYVQEHCTPDRFDQYLRDPEVTLAVADLGGLVGYSLLIVGERAQAGRGLGVTTTPAGLLSKLYVDERYRGAGVAGALMEAVIRDALQLGVRGLWLNTNDDNGRARRFYVKHGFVQVGSVDFTVGDVVLRDPVYQLSLI